jgi:hypothetical protein
MNVARVNPLSIGELRIAAEAAAWERCGFAIRADGVTAVGLVRLQLAGGAGGITGWALGGIEAGAELDGLPTETIEEAAEEEGQPRPEHPLGVTRIDHLVAMTPDLQRTVTALERAGLDLRRVREPSEPGPPVRQAFFRLGEVILEVVESPEAEGAARFWGITFRVADLDRCAELLGERLGEVRDAVQPGRRIATVRRTAGLGLPVALISEPARR